jgi:hypothetical protein
VNKAIIFISLVVSAILINFGVSVKAQVDGLKIENSQLQADNFDMTQKIKIKGSLPKQAPVLLSMAYSVVLNQIRLLESNSGTSMNIKLEGAMDTQDISSHYEDTPYKGIKGLKIQIVVDKFSKETDMGAVLDDIHLLEKNTDFMSTEISKDNSNLIVKGEVYGI